MQFRLDPEFGYGVAMPLKHFLNPFSHLERKNYVLHDVKYSDSYGKNIGRSLPFIHIHEVPSSESEGRLL